MDLQVCTRPAEMLTGPACISLTAFAGASQAYNVSTCCLKASQSIVVCMTPKLNILCVVGCFHNDVEL